MADSFSTSSNLQPNPRLNPAPGSNPAPSQAFDLLDERIRRWIWEQKWSELRDVQERAIQVILRGDQDVILSAATASGKTEAAFLPILTRMVQEPKPSIRALYISPLKALINDQFSRLELLCERLDIPVHRWHGDVDQARKRRILKSPEGILLITPESLEAMLMHHGTSLTRLFAHLDYTVTDELHAFIGSERGTQLQSLLNRIEVAANRRIPRVALSATLSELSIAADFLRPGEGKQVECIVSESTGQEIRAQIRGYICKVPKALGREMADEEESGAMEDAEATGQESETENLLSGDFGDGKAAIADHLFKTLRGGYNLVFANARQEVETFTDLLSRMSDRNRVQAEFFPHHGNLSREIREDVEERLKETSRPTTAICTSTLEMGIDIGNMTSIAQVGVPPSVASLRQRAGRSGRRGEPCRLRIYAREMEVTPNTPLQDVLRLETVQMAVMLQLMVAGWCEPPIPGALHLSTLIQQTLSVIAQRGGIQTVALYNLLCRTGPFRDIDTKLFAEFLRCLHAADLITQMQDGTLLPGTAGERLIAHYTFYAAFATPEEYRVISQGKTLGTLPVENPILPDSYIVYAGRRWRVEAVDTEHKIIDLLPAKGGKPPAFGGGGIWVHTRVRRAMLGFYLSKEEPAFLDTTALEFVREGRENFHRYALDGNRVVASGKNTLVFLWSGDQEAETLRLALHREGVKAEGDGVCLSLPDTNVDETRRILRELSKTGLPDPMTLALLVPNQAVEKHDHFLTPPLLALQYSARFIDIPGATRALDDVLEFL